MDGNGFYGEVDLKEHLGNLEREIEELKIRRSEDAKANEKVVRIFAAQEQSWLCERKILRQHMGALMSKLRVLDKKKNESFSEYQEKLKAMELLVESKEKLLEEEEQKRKEVEKIAQELRKTANREAQDHSTEIRKHKTALIELVSNRRQLEAEMNRVVRQAEVMKQQIDIVLEQKEESVIMAQKLSMEVATMHEDLEQKDNILSAMLRKSKLDATEKQRLLKEIKLSESRGREKHSLRNMFATYSNSKSQSSQFALEYEDDDLRIDSEAFPPFAEGKQEFCDVKRLEGWVLSETGKYANVIEKRHHLELDAFVEQMRLKNEKLETFRLRCLSMESHIEGLSHNGLRLRHDNMNLKALLIERDKELNCLKEQFTSLLKSQNIQSPDKKNDILSSNDSKIINLTVQSPDKEFEDEKVIIVIDQLPIQEQADNSVKKVSPTRLPFGKINNNHQWRMDLNALGVSYKIKRLKQQLVMLERLTGKQDSEKDTAKQGFLSLMSLLTKQVSRYQSLEGKADDLCKRMHDHGEGIRSLQTKTLEHFLEETFQLQRYIVASGQKMMEIQSKIVSEFVWIVKEEVEISCSFDVKRFADNVGTLFREVQRGLELRIARIIGDLEGTLACEGMMHIKDSNFFQLTLQ
ncbi:hypothetical protein ACFE04_026939 [Oxalis oulophora]